MSTEQKKLHSSGEPVVDPGPVKYHEPHVKKPKHADRRLRISISSREVEAWLREQKRKTHLSFTKIGEHAIKFAMKNSDGETTFGSRSVPKPAAVDLPPECENDHGPMVKRTATHGPNSGGQFWGCSEFPDCSFSLDLDGSPSFSALSKATPELEFDGAATTPPESMSAVVDSMADDLKRRWFTASHCVDINSEATQCMLVALSSLPVAIPHRRKDILDAALIVANKSGIVIGRLRYPREYFASGLQQVKKADLLSKAKTGYYRMSVEQNEAIRLIAASAGYNDRFLFLNAVHTCDEKTAASIEKITGARQWAETDVDAYGPPFSPLDELAEPEHDEDIVDGPDVDEKLYTVAEIADTAGISYSAVYGAVERGEIAHVRIGAKGRRIFITTSDWRDFLSNARNNGKQI